MLNKEEIDRVRNLQKTGAHLVRLAGYAAIGVPPSRENLQNARRWFQEASADVDAMLNHLETAAIADPAASDSESAGEGSRR